MLFLLHAPNIFDGSLVSPPRLEDVVKDSYRNSESCDENVPVHLSRSRILVQWEERKNECQDQKT